MTDETVGKEPEDFALVPSGGTKLTKHSKPTLMQIGTRWMTSDGRWHPDLAADYVLHHGGTQRWIPVGELARVFFGGGSPSNKARVRFRLHHVLRVLLAKGWLLVVEYGERSAAQAVKIYNAKSDVERAYVHERLKRMAHLKTMKAEQFERAVSLVQQADEELHDVVQP